MRGFECHSVRSLLLFTLFVYGVSGTLDVNQNRESVILRLDEDEHLQCSTTLPIKACLFLTPDNEKLFIYENAVYDRLADASETPTECKIRIPSISEKDNGDWTCVLSALSEDGRPIQGNATISVTVAVPPTDMKLFVDDVEAESTELQMKLIPDDQKAIKCLAVDPRPAPTFKWTLNGEPLNGQIEDSQEVGENGKISYAQTLQYYPKANHNGVELKCSLSHYAYTPEQLDLGVNEKGLNIKLLYKPLESEKRQEFYIQREGESKNFNMVFDAFPEPTEVYWDLSGMDSLLQQGASSLNEKYSSSELTPGDTNGEYSIMLTINGVTAEDTKNESSLFVKNSEGETEYKFKINLGQEPAAESMGSGPVVAVVIIILIILILIGLALLIRSKGLFCFAAKSKKGHPEDPERPVEKEGSDTESSEDRDPKGNSKRSGSGSVTAKVSNLFAAMKSVAKTAKESSSNNPTNKSDEPKDPSDEKRDFERGGSDVTYADLDKSVLSQGNRSSTTQSNNATEYAEIQHNK